jgi:hypothetical protein
MKTFSSKLLLALSLFATLTACNDKPERRAEEKPKVVQPRVQRLEGISVPQFSGDSAYSFVEQQLAFGPRVPNTKEHRLAGSWLVETLKGYGAQVIEQDFTAETYDGQELFLKNIIASYKPEAKKRLMLAAHWDTRPFADKDTDSLNWQRPIAGANDGASGVAVLLEVARLLSQNQLPDVGVDLVLFDGEDWGEPEFYDEELQQANAMRGKMYWCLGSQYWAARKHTPNYTAYYGILLDMVGAKDALFYQEGFSRQFAPSVVKKVWAWGQELGHGNHFIAKASSEVTDDHYFMNQGGVPSIDIIQYDPADDFYFGSYHHTLQDDIDIISKETLQAVGETVLHVVYHEPAPGV